VREASLSARMEETIDVLLFPAVVELKVSGNDE
jgi:hypothetical protein